MANAELAQRRILAWLIDFLVVMALALLFQRPGWLAGAVYILLRDSLFNNGQSIGKRLLRLQVVVGPDRLRCRIPNSVIRNILWVLPLVNLAMAVAGLYYLSSDRAGRHWGDRLANSRVVTV